MKSSGIKKFLIGCSGIGLIVLLIAGATLWFIVSGLLETVNRNTAGGYVVSGGKVKYYTGLRGFGPPQSWEITEADAATFKNLGEGYAVDKNSAYLDGQILLQSSGTTFKIIKKPYAADQNHVFYDNSVLSNSPKNFKFIAREAKKSGTNDRFDFSTDGEKIFYGSKAVFSETLDAATFELIGATDYFKDKNHVYTLKNIIEGADPATFEVIPEYLEIYSKDKTSVFYDGVKIEDCDARTDKILNGNIHTDARHVFFNVHKFSDDPGNFRLLTSGYSKDRKNVYWQLNKVSTDVANFKVFPSTNTITYAKDAKSVYWCDKKLEKADVGTFVGLESGYGKDKNNVWFGSNPEDQPRVVENADAATFEIYQSDAVDARDKNNNFHFGNVKERRN